MFDIFKSNKEPAFDSSFKKKDWPLLSFQEIAIRKRGAIIGSSLDSVDTVELSRVQLEAMKLGYVFSEQAAKPIANDKSLEKEVFNVLQSLVGANKSWEPFYPNFPKQVANASDIELFLNSITHYWACGQWKPQYTKESRLPLFEEIKLKKIELLPKDELLSLFYELLSSNGSISEKDYEIIYSLLRLFDEAKLLENLPEEVPFKEVRCQLLAFSLELNLSRIVSMGVTNTTDVLRVATALSGGDISLAANTKFKLKRRYRKWLVLELEKVINEDDVKRHAKKWKRLFHCLHIGEYKAASKSNDIADKLRNAKLKGMNTEVEAALLKKNDVIILEKLLSKPGEFARRLDHLLRIFTEEKAQNLLAQFNEVVDQVDTRVLIQMLGHFRHRIVSQRDHIVHGKTETLHTRVALPKGQIANVKVLKSKLKDIDPRILADVVELIEKNLKERFSRLPSLGKVWIDPELAKCPVPIQMRSASEGLKIVQRGTRMPMGDKNTLRFFIHWVGEDIDLSAAFLTEKLKFHSEIAYYKLKRNSKDGYQAVHSGDITYAPAPEGACEFIDINLDSINTDEIRYIAMDIRVYEGPPFPAQEANVGWMMRDGLGEAGEVFDAKTVEQRISISATSYSCMVAMFDVKKKEVIWLDLLGTSNYLKGGNNVANNRFNIEDLLEASLNFHQVSMYDLLHLHAQARGEVVQSPIESESQFNKELIFSYEKILSEFLS
ncbi:TerD family protein [Pleionea sp. CnH1-48]|uniref:TerD family protein n=1 Tax=Pleionea sp. CnH1-48 TaxID=2954494 RepID=UPI002096C5E0|nr:TerD family protein [Pleionea sp. CnH1-48]MCO7223243.1 TerD family protein [Pleionea sp. CnH1-48]